MNSVVPALSYPIARANATAASLIRARSSGSSAGDGDSSSTFWWRRRTRADPREARVEHGLGQLGALGEEAVAGVDGVGAGGARSAHLLVHVEVGRHLDRRIRRASVQGVAVVGRRDRGRLDPEGAA